MSHVVTYELAGQPTIERATSLDRFRLEHPVVMHQINS